MPSSDYADAQADFGLRCPYMTENRFSQGAAQLTAKFFKQGYRYHNQRKTVLTKFYHSHSELMSKYNVGLNTRRSVRT